LDLLDPFSDNFRKFDRQKRTDQSKPLHPQLPFHKGSEKGGSMKLKVTQNHEKLKKKSFLNVPLQLLVEILMRGFGMGSPEKLAQVAEKVIFRRLLKNAQMQGARNPEE
jgi:hypothetical protein